MLPVFNQLEEHVMQLDDTTFLSRFASRDLGPEYFDHRGHLRMAWLHLTHFSLEEAIERVCAGIGELATRFGAPEKYNHTLTEASMRIMARRMQNQPAVDFDRFLEQNPDLVEDAWGVLLNYYTEERLVSPAAKQAWLAPDRSSIDAA
jgi:hypothetical protein